MSRFARLRKLCYGNRWFQANRPIVEFNGASIALAFLIVATDISERDISIERLFLKTEAARLFPERFKFYKMLYESRFDRLVEQFRRNR
jgi:hypothetical protein